MEEASFSLLIVQVKDYEFEVIGCAIIVLLHEGADNEFVCGCLNEVITPVEVQAHLDIRVLLELIFERIVGEGRLPAVEVATENQDLVAVFERKEQTAVNGALLAHRINRVHSDPVLFLPQVQVLDLAHID